MLAGLSPARQRALAIADNKIAENAGWDRGRLAIEIPELAGLLETEGLDVSILGFEAVEIDQLVTDFEDNAADPEDNVDPTWLKDRAVNERENVRTADHFRNPRGQQDPHARVLVPGAGGEIKARAHSL